MKLLFTVFYDPKDLGVRYLKSYLTLKGHDVHIVALKELSDLPQSSFTPNETFLETCTTVRAGYATSYNFCPITDQELELLTEEIKTYSPDIVGFGTRSINFHHLPRIIPALKKGAKNAFLVAGGAGPTIDPQLPLNLGVDAVIRGEGEYAFHELITALETGNDWHTIKNISYLNEQGMLVRNAMRPPQKNLDVFPFPSNDLENDIVIDNNTKYPLFNKNDLNTTTYGSNYRYFILGSRGCIAQCSYCGGRYFCEEYKKDGIVVPRVRQRSLHNIMDELVSAKNKCNMKMVQFWDEFFIWPIPKLIDFFSDYKKKINLPFWAYLSADQLAHSPELLEVVCDAGLGTFMGGIQTGDENFCKKIYNRINHNENFLKVAFEMAKRYIPVHLLMIAGNPLQDEASHRKNWEFLAKLPAFDPSFKQYTWMSYSKLNKPFYNTVLYKKFPNLIDNVSTQSFYYEAMISNLRLILGDIEFEQIISDEQYKINPILLGKLYLDTLIKRHTDYLEPEIERLAGHEVYFWGSGTAYQKKKHLFVNTKPVCVLNDFTWEAPTTIDGLSVVDPEKAELDVDKPLVIFARHEYVHAIHRKAKNTYGFKDIVVAANIE